MVSSHDTGGIMNLEGLNKFMETIETFGGSLTCLIAKHDSIIYERAVGFANYEEGIRNLPSIAMSIGSISKQITATGIMKLVEYGQVSITDTLAKFFENVPSDKYQINIHQLLTHTSGIVEDPVDDFDYIPKDEYIRAVLEAPLGFSPGSSYSYSNTGYSLLAMIIEEVTGKDYRDFVREDLFGGIGLSEVGWFADKKWTKKNSVTYYVDGSPTGGPYSWPGSGDRPYWGILGNGGVCLSAKSLYRWMHAVFEGGFLTQASIKSMLTPEKEEYGYGWVITHSPLGQVITHNGGSTLGVNAVAKYFPQSGFYLILLSNITDNGTGLAFVCEKPIEELILGQSLNVPDNLEPIGMKFHNADLPKGVEIKQDQIGRWHIIASDVESVNFLNGYKVENQELYVETAQKWVQALLQRDFEKAFSFTANKSNDEARIKRMEQLIGYLIHKIGEIKKIRPMGVIQGDGPYPVEVYLEFTGNRDSIGIPILFEKPSEVKGLRPTFTKQAIRWPLAKDGDSLVAWNWKKNLFTYISMNKRK